MGSKRCETCSEPFIPYKSNSKFCSKKCSSRAYRKRKCEAASDTRYRPAGQKTLLQPATIQCARENCDVWFTTWQCRRIYCSPLCANEHYRESCYRTEAARDRYRRERLSKDTVRLVDRAYSPVHLSECQSANEIERMAKRILAEIYV